MTARPINILTAELVGDYRIGLRFDDGKEQIVDFQPFLSHSSHPAIRAYLDPGRFAAFHVEFGDLVWGDYDLCFPIMALYRNRLEHGAPLQAAA